MIAAYAIGVLTLPHRTLPNQALPRRATPYHAKNILHCGFALVFVVKEFKPISEVLANFEPCLEY